MSEQASGTPPSVEFCITHKVKLTSPALKQAHMTPDCMVYTPAGVENFDSSPVGIIDPIAVEATDNVTYDEVVYPVPEGSTIKSGQKTNEQSD